MGAIIIVDAFWGDSGKGKISAYLTRRENAELCVRAGIGTNAGHSLYLGTLKELQLISTRQLPLGFLNPLTMVAVGAGVAVNPSIFQEEVEKYHLQDRARVDYRCPIITEEHIKQEQESAHLSGKIGSTCSGSGAARADFVLRKAGQAKDIAGLQPYVTDVAYLVNKAARSGTVIVEGSQGALLSLGLSPDYPYVTSGDCTSLAAAAQIGLGWQNISEAVMVLKALPSRVGEGPLPNELSADEIKERGIAEHGVVTGRLRRKAVGIPWGLLRYVAILNSPTQIALTFCEHYDPEVEGVTTRERLTPKVWELITKVEAQTGTPVTLVGTGKLFEHIVDLSERAAHSCVKSNNKKEFV
ncbi:adenylosuccinate synthetase [Patescibacteria group bacterium]|nr:adenylosuccinate synthetase [Patescibacteria group bacterium]MBU4512263.1 adenylosuccinate synthetase [Patescibacteria group bacterium]MCG2692939.1 adenylosuccinate synthetase [Candidatus Parcubacteria bacterium]